MQVHRIKKYISFPHTKNNFVQFTQYVTYFKFLPYARFILRFSIWSAIVYSCTHGFEHDF